MIRPGVAAIALIACLGVFGRAQAQVTPFSTDVATSIDNGIAYFAANGAYNDYPSNFCGDAAGLALLALLEKRVDANPNAVSQGYSAATATHQGYMRTA